MRVLCLSNFYPPASRGGYEQWCQEVSEGLRARGHEVVVLTSDHACDTIAERESDWIFRDLLLEMEIASLRNGVQFFTARSSREAKNLACLRRHMVQTVPDIVLVWGMWNLSRSIPALAEQLLPGRVVYYMGDYWPTLPSQFDAYWRAPARNWVTAVPKNLMKPVALRMLRKESQPTLKFEHAIFPTAFMRNELQRLGMSAQHSEIVYGAIDTRPYRCNGRPSAARLDSTTQLLYVGRLSPEKGVHTAIEALSHLAHERNLREMRLTVVGSGEPDYESYLQQLALDQGVASAVTFLRAQPKEAMPALYAQMDILLFTSIWPEPFGRVLVEAMASGVAIVGARTGGAAEILAAGENALTYTPGDSVELAAQIARLVESPEIRTKLVDRARHIAVDRFDLHRMTAELEVILEQIVYAPA